MLVDINLFNTISSSVEFTVLWYACYHFLHLQYIAICQILKGPVLIPVTYRDKDRTWPTTCPYPCRWQDFIKNFSELQPGSRPEWGGGGVRFLGRGSSLPQAVHSHTR